MSDKNQKIEIEIDYDNHHILSAKGLPDGTELRLREEDINLGYIIKFFEIKDGKPKFIEEKVECRSCGATGEWSVELGGGTCPFCNGTKYV